MTHIVYNTCYLRGELTFVFIAQDGGPQCCHRYHLLLCLCVVAGHLWRSTLHGHFSSSNSAGPHSNTAPSRLLSLHIHSLEHLHISLDRRGGNWRLNDGGSKDMGEGGGGDGNGHLGNRVVSEDAGVAYVGRRHGSGEGEACGRGTRPREEWNHGRRKVGVGL